MTWFLLLTMLAGFVALPHQTGGADQEDVAPGEASRDAPTARLAEEVRRFGWLVFSAPSERGDWDLFACRPDGSDRRNLTRTPESNEVGAQFSRDGRRLLFRRLPVAETIDGNHYGTQGELVLAAAMARARPFSAKWENFPGRAGVQMASKSLACPSRGSRSSTWPPGKSFKSFLD